MSAVQCHTFVLQEEIRPYPWIGILEVDFYFVTRAEHVIRRFRTSCPQADMLRVQPWAVIWCPSAFRPSGSDGPLW